MESDTLNVRFGIAERQGVATKVRWRLVNAAGEEVATSVDILDAATSGQVYSGTIEFPHSDVARDQISRLHRIAFGAASLEWVLTIEDEIGHVLDAKVVPVQYRW